MRNGKQTSSHEEGQFLRPLRVTAADPDPGVRALYADFLPLLGHETVGVAANAEQLIRECLRTDPELVVASAELPDLDVFEVIAQVNRRAPTPFLLVSARDNPGLVERASACPVYGFLVKPLKTTDLGPAVALARLLFERVQALGQEAAELRQALEDRKLIERAKGVVSRRLGLNEEDGFRRLRELASERQQKLAEVARWVLAAEETFEALEVHANGKPTNGHGGRAVRSAV